MGTGTYPQLHIENLEAAKRDLERKLDDVTKLLGSARAHILVAAAIETLRKHAPEALDSHVSRDAFGDALEMAVADLVKGEGIASIIPF